MIVRKKEFTLGVILLISFFVVFFFFFTPVFEGHTGLDYLDNLYNSISKGSADFIPKLREEAKIFQGAAVDLSFAMKGPAEAQEASQLFAKTGAAANVSGANLKVAGDLGKILEGVLNDAEAMYNNDGKTVAGRYGFDERLALYHWWTAFKGVEKSLNDQKKFKEAKAVANISKKGIETSYNYYTVKPQNIMDRLGVVIFSLVFYVVYTLWYGFAILFIFEGVGMQLEH